MSTPDLLPSAGVRLKRIAVAFTGLAVVALGLAPATFAPAQSASADTAPTNGLPTTVTADSLPTVQINQGVVWSETTVGNIVYAIGNFTKARPAGSAEGVNETPRGGLLAFDITTGVMTSWNHSLNGAGLFITHSPDNSTLYIAGDFTTVDAQPRTHIAAFDVASGTLKANFAPTFNGTLKTLAVTNDTVYAGGAFDTVNGSTASKNYVSLSAATGAVNTAFTGETTYTSTSNAPTSATVTAMTISPDATTLLVAGRYDHLKGVARVGMGGVDVTTGAVMPWSANWTVRDNNVGASFTALKTFEGHIYASGYTTGFLGNFEGTMELDKTGNVVWLNSCHGDTYDLFGVGGVLYTASHEHDCSDIGAWEETTPRIWHRANATSATVSNDCIVGHNDNYNGPTPTNNNSAYFDFGNYGYKCAPLLPWDPNFEAGTFTGATQGPWAASGNSNYLTMGGEFPTVNGIAQYGLARFAKPNLAPKATGPKALSGLLPNVLSQTPGTARISWRSTWDQDNENLTYKIYRGNTGSTPIYTVTAPSRFWDMPNLGFTDTGQSPTAPAKYRLTVSDPDGNTIGTDYSLPILLNGSATSTSPYYQDVVADGADNYWRLDEPAANIYGVNSVSDNDMIMGATPTRATSGALSDDTATDFDGTAEGYASSQTRTQAPNTFTAELWFKTTSTTGGKLMGYGSANTGTSAHQMDRQVYMDKAGRVYFGVNNTGNTLFATSTPAVITSSPGFNNGAWHHVAAEMSSAGMVLYLDGRVVGRNATTAGTSYQGYWRIGGDNVTYWPVSSATANNSAGTGFIAASIDEVATYPSALNGNQVQKHYVDSGRALSGPTDAFGKVVYADGPDVYYRMDEPSGTTAIDSSGNGRPGTYTATTLGTASPVSTGFGTAATYNGTTSNLSSNTAVTPPTTYSEEAWFKTSTTAGGKIIGFQSAQTGTTGTYDRVVYMLTTGKLVFGVQPTSSTTSRVLATSPASYNDGKWHQVVATQSASGMKLYVDGAVVATTTATAALTYASGGYWRIGGGSSFAAASAFFPGVIDEAAVYSYELPADTVNTHWLTAGVANRPPTAAFTSVTGNLDVTFDGTSSTDPDGNVASYAWTFGDATTGTGANPTHVYASPGTYSVALTVTDNSGATNTITKSVTTDQPPLATLTTTRSNLAVTASASASTDADGTIASYAWDFGDGFTATGVTASHTYASAGSYPIILTVTDNKGATGTAAKTVVVAINQLPTAAFTSTVTGSSVALNATASSDPDGTIAAYAWNFGDGTNGSGATVSHSYLAPGTYTVTLTVTDDLSGTGTTSQSVGITSFAVDTFSRTVANGWGAAGSGGAWTVSTATSGVFSVNGNAAKMTLATAGSSRNAYLNGISSTDTDVSITVAADKLTVGSSTYFTLAGRKVTGQGEYRAKVLVAVSGAVSIQLVQSNTAGTETAITGLVPVSGLTYSGGTVLQIRMRAVGTSPTALAAKVWNSGLSEPAAWQTTASDSTAGLQAAGGVGVIGYIGSATTNAPVVLTFDSLLATTSGAAGGNQAPVASFTTSVANQTVTADASASSDSDGTITSYAWKFGDGATASGATATHAYASPGTYVVTLTLTDDDGAISSVTHSVTTNQPPLAAFTTSQTYLTVTANSAGSSDSDASIASYVWSFGDGTTDTTAVASHTYATAGQYVITLVVTDNAGATSTAATTVTVAANVAPTASFTASSTDLSVQTDASASTDPDGTISGYAWSFDDGATTTGVTATHAFTTSGSHVITLTITDSAGAISATTRTIVLNQSPIATFTVDKDLLQVTTNASESSDPDGSIVSYSWDFGDGGTDSGVTASHNYDSGGTYTITVAVTDNSGTTTFATQPVTVVAPQAPVASFTATSTNLTFAFDGSSSTDADGTITGYAWDFGDGTAGSGNALNHTYAVAGSYPVTLTVTDNNSLTGTSTRTVSTNQPPVAAFTSTQNYLAVAFDGSTSSDSDGTVANYAWDFGDGQTGTGAPTSHTYANPGTYTVTLTVTDNQGATGTVSNTVTVVANSAPVASFTATATGGSVAFNANASSDAEGPIAGYAWNFGDGTNGAGATITHVYATTGSYTVTLTVTDGAGATNSSAQLVPVTVPAGVTTLASDDFTRTSASAWGTAPTGGAWTVAAAPAFSVNGSAGVINQTAGTTFSAYLNSVSSNDTDLRLLVADNKVPTGGGTYITVAGRKVTGQGEYRAKVQLVAGGAVKIQLIRSNSAGTETAIGTAATVVGLNYTAGMVLQVRMQVTGTSPTTFQARVWNNATTEPTGWQVTATDSTAGLQAAGSIGLLTYASSSTTNAPQSISFDTLRATTTAPAAPNSPPTAVFTSSTTGATASFNAAASSDSDGSIASYAWNFGDGTTGTGVTPSHAYAASGTYTVTLTVTDNRGATGSSSGPIAVTVPAGPVPFAADDFGRTASASWGSATPGGAWTVSAGANFSVNGTAGVINQTAGGSSTAYLNSVSSNDTDVQFSVALNKVPTGGGTYITVAGRKVTGQGEYRAKVQLVAGGAVKIQLIRTNSAGTETAIGAVATVTGLSYTAGMVLQLRMQVWGVGTTNFRAKVWTGAAEPTWQVTNTDVTAGLQTAGSIGLITYASSSTTNAPQTITIDGLRATVTGN